MEREEDLAIKMPEKFIDYDEMDEETKQLIHDVYFEALVKAIVREETKVR